MDGADNKCMKYLRHGPSEDPTRGEYFVWRVEWRGRGHNSRLRAGFAMLEVVCENEAVLFSWNIF